MILVPPNTAVERAQHGMVSSLPCRDVSRRNGGLCVAPGRSDKLEGQE
jgi:hypothetical protein